MGVKELLQGAADNSQNLIKKQKEAEFSVDQKEEKSDNKEILKAEQIEQSPSIELDEVDKEQIKPKTAPVKKTKKPETRGRKKTKNGDWTRFAIDIPTELYEEIKEYAEEYTGGNITRAGAKLMKYALADLNK